MLRKSLGKQNQKIKKWKTEEKRYENEMINLRVSAFSLQILHKERTEEAGIRKLLKKENTKIFPELNYKGLQVKRNQQEPRKKGFTSKYIFMNFQKKQRISKLSKERIKIETKQMKQNTFTYKDSGIRMALELLKATPEYGNIA